MIDVNDVRVRGFSVYSLRPTVTSCVKSPLGKILTLQTLNDIIPTGSPLAGALNTGKVQKICDFRPIRRYISQTIQDSAIVTT